MYSRLPQMLLLLALPYVRCDTICENVRCAVGELCDPLTGICRRFQHSESKTSVNLCNTVGCPDDTECDIFSGLCLDSTNRASSEDKCDGVICPSEEGCDWNTGRCVRFRKPFHRNIKNCTDVFCPQNTECDPNSGLCRQIRPLLARILHLHTQPPPPSLPPSAQQQPSCEEVVCPNGFECNPKDAICYRSKDMPTNKCALISCPTGEACDETTGQCKRLPNETATERVPSTASVTIPETLCTNVTCPDEMICETSSGICKKLNSSATQSSNVCSIIECPNGFECNPNDGICHRKRQWKQVLSRPTPCPLHSHYVECGSACPYTCTNLRRACSTPCVSTCQCDDAYMQVSLTNLTCVPIAQCGAFGRNMCANLRCPDDTICMDGYCNPVNCPNLMKPNLPKGCAYKLNRDNRNCIAFDIVC